MRYLCVLFVSSMSSIVFNPSSGAVTDHRQRTSICISSPSSMQRTQPPKAGAHFTKLVKYCNTESECMLEINFGHGWDFEIISDQHLTIKPLLFRTKEDLCAGLQ